MKKITLLFVLLLGGCFLLNAQADLSLTGSIDNADPGIYANVTLTAVLTNNGSETAHNIRCQIPSNFLSSGYGLVLGGSSVDLGTYDWLSNWRVDSLPAGQSATLEVQCFTMKPQLPIIRGQVFSVDEDDPDSTPGNLAYDATIAVEDDEFLIDPMATPCDIDIEILSNECSNSSGFATIQYRINTSNTAYERFKVNRYFGQNNQTYTDVLPNQIQTMTVSSNTFSNRLVATPFFETDNCFAEASFNTPNCNTAPCTVGLGFQNISCVEDAAGEKYWTLSGFVFSNQSGNFRISVNGAQTRPYPYYQGEVFGVGGAGSDLDIASNPVLTVLVSGSASGTFCDRTYIFNAANHCSDLPTNINCGPRGLFPWHEWISRVQFDGIDNSSAAAEYTDYTAIQSVVEAGTTIPIDIKVNYSYLTYDEFARVWIDYNADGSFSSDELAFEQKLSAPTAGVGATGTLSGMITIPPTAKNGKVRMRIALRRGGYAGSCERFAFGEVEDYALTIMGGDVGGCQPTATATDVSCNNNGTPNDASDDIFYFTYNPSGIGLETGTAIYLANATEKLVYDIENAETGKNFQVGPISIANNPTLMVQHVTSGFPYSTITPICAYPTLLVTAPATCSDGMPTDCGLSATVSNITCDPGSFFTSQDDKFSFDLLIEGANAGDPVSVYPSVAAYEYSSASVNFDVQNAFVGSTFNVGPVFLQNYPEIRLVVALPNSGSTCVLDPVVVSPDADCLNPSGEPTANCTADSEYPWEDWISNVKIGDLDSPSGKSVYSDFRNIRTANMTLGQTVSVELTTTFSWFAYKEYWRVWIDYNQDNIYTTDEIAFEGTLPKPPDGAVMRTVLGEINVPVDALEGSTSMRVIMTRNSFAPPCGTVLTGEVEDYSVELLMNPILKQGNTAESGYQAELKPDLFSLYPNPTSTETMLWAESLLGKSAELQLVNGMGTIVRNWSYETVKTPLMRLDLGALGNGVYTLRINTPGLRTVTKKVVIINE